jgi:GNAT superfamily N-acetyltransferase
MSAVSRTFEAIVNRLFYSYRCIVEGARLDPARAVESHVGDISFRLATASDLERLDELEPYGRGSRQRRFVEQDHEFLFVACDGARIVATARYGRVVRDSVVSRVIALEPGQIWGADAFCLPEYRNRGVTRRLTIFANQFLASMGYRQTLGTIAVTNTASLRMIRKKGNEPLYYISYLRVLFWERLRVSKTVPEQVWSGSPSAKHGGT